LFLPLRVWFFRNSVVSGVANLVLQKQRCSWRCKFGFTGTTLFLKFQTWIGNSKVVVGSSNQHPQEQGCLRIF